MNIEVMYQINGPLSSKAIIFILCGRHDQQKYCYGHHYPRMVVGNVAEVAFKFKRMVGDKCSKQHIISWISGKNCKKPEGVVIKMAVTCEKIGYSEQWTCSEHEEWREMGIIHHISECDNVCNYILEVDMNVCELESPLVKLYNDNVFTDFNLCSEEGSVAVHRACLALHSDMFKTMFGGQWKETVESRIEPDGVTLQTLQHFKDYLYLGSLPEHGLRELLLLAMRYMIDSLKTECVKSLAKKVTENDLFDLLEFARKNEIPELMLAITELTPKKVVEGISKSLEELEVNK